MISANKGIFFADSFAPFTAFFPPFAALIWMD